MKDLTPAAWDFLGEVGLRNPDLARALRDEITAGTFVLLDGEPLTRESSTRRADRAENIQLTFDTKGREA